jgi:predicted O-linked N-acetylglucosamine transferase (SPINDLY family)
MTQFTVEQAMQAALDHYRAGRRTDAESICRLILTAQSDHGEALHLLGLLAGHAGRNNQAADLIRKAIAAAPGNPAYRLHLGRFEQDLGRLDAAIACYQQALALKPDLAEAHYNLGIAWKAKGQDEQAVASYRRAIALKADFAPAHNNLGMALIDMGRHDQAVACFERALALEPDSALVHNNLGMAQARSGLPQAAIACYQRALSLKSDCVEALCNMGNALSAMGDLERAIACFQRALLLRPQFVAAHNALGTALRQQGHLDQAAAAHQRALEIDPGRAETHAALAAFWNDAGQLDRTIACLCHSLLLDPTCTITHNSLIASLHFHPDTVPETLAAEYRTWNRQHAQPVRRLIRPHSNDRDPHRRLRIGYVSPNFRNHPVGRFMLPLMRCHNHAGFEVFCYSSSRETDKITATLKSHADVWQNIVGLSDEQAADMIRQDRIDILVDLTMHMVESRLLIFARKPAPVQVTYLAYASGTALDAIDYRLTDRHLDPDPAGDRFYTEKSIRLQGTYWCYQQSIDTPPVSELPAIAAGTITLGCLNNFSKVSPAALETWARLLNRLGDARLVLHARNSAQREIAARFMADRGITVDRLQIVGWMAPEEYFENYLHIDIALDPFPFAGGTTTCDALWMGVPVVTLSGRLAVGRAGVSILSNAGVPELIARTADEYVQIAADLAADRPRLTELRATLRQRMLSSPLMDASRFARDVEDAYRTMWQTWCEK